MTISIAVTHLQRVVVGVDLCGAERELRGGISVGRELGAAVVKDVVVAEGEHAVHLVRRIVTTRERTWKIFNVQTL